MQQLEVEADVDSSRVQAGSVAAVFGLVTPQMMLTYRPPLQTFTLLILGPQWTLGEMDLHTLSLLFNFRFLLWRLEVAAFCWSDVKPAVTLRCRLKQTHMARCALQFGMRPRTQSEAANECGVNPTPAPV